MIPKTKEFSILNNYWGTQVVSADGNTFDVSLRYEAVSLVTRLIFPENYPESFPEIFITTPSGLTLQDCNCLKFILSYKVKRLIGLPMINTILQTVEQFIRGPQLPRPIDYLHSEDGIDLKQFENRSLPIPYLSDNLTDFHLVKPKSFRNCNLQTLTLGTLESIVKKDIYQNYDNIDIESIVNPDLLLQFVRTLEEV